MKRFETNLRVLLMLKLKIIISAGTCPNIHLPFYNKVFYLNEFLSKTPSEHRYTERSVFMKEVNNKILWNFKLDSQESMNVPIWINIGFQQQDRQDSQTLNNDGFCRLPITSAQFIFEP